MNIIEFIGDQSADEMHEAFYSAMWESVGRVDIVYSPFAELFLLNDRFKMYISL